MATHQRSHHHGIGLRLALLGRLCMVLLLQGYVGASDAEVTVAADDGIVSIPYADINRSNLVEE